MRRKTKVAPEDVLAGVYPLLQRGPGGIPLPPKPTYGGLPPTPTTQTPGTNPSGGSGTGPKKPGSGAAGAGGASSSSSSSGGVSTYQGYLNAQKKEANKAKRSAANTSIANAEALRAQANALLHLLGKEPGPGANPFTVGNGGGNKNGGKGAGSIRGNVHWTGGTGWKPDGSGPKNPSQGGGVRTGTDVKPMPGQGPKFGGGNKPPVFNMPRSAAGRNAAIEGVAPGDSTRKNQQAKPGQGGKGGNGARPGWSSGDDWKDRPGQGGKGGGGKGGKDKDGGRGGRNLDNDGLAGELKTNLRNVERAMRTADELLLGQYGERVAELGKAAGDNDKAVNAQGFANQTNRGRERANAMSELIAQGAGESDALRAQGMSLRNWEQNQNDVNRSFFDTLTTINSSLKDTTIDTRSARVQNRQDAIDDKQQLWNEYFNASSEAYTNLGNTYGQMATEYRNADEQIDGKKGKKAKRRAKRLGDKSADAFMKAADFGQRSHKATAVEDEYTEWKGADEFAGNMNNSTYRGGAGVAMERAEGATLRRWNA